MRPWPTDESSCVYSIIKEDGYHEQGICDFPTMLSNQWRSKPYVTINDSKTQ